MDGSVKFHRFRYHLASGFVTPTDTVYDLGSGSGYGSFILSEKAGNVIGIEKEQSEVTAAIEKYRNFNLSFSCNNLETVELENCHVACSFEVIEHLYKPKEFIDRIKQATSKYIIFSVPVGQKLVWMEEAKEFQEVGDSTHKSVFANGDEIMGMFIDDNWKEFFRLQLGVTFIGIVYNQNFI